MFNSSSDLTPAPPPKTLGKDPATLSTDEHGRPVPYLAGRARLGLTWISEPWGVRSVPIRKKVGKKTQTTGYNYYASFAGLLCLGPVQTLHAILVDDEVAWNGPLQAGTNDHAEITVEGRGALTLYWGTAAQTADADLAASGVTHPAYRGQCYAVFNDWLLGENRAQVPNLEFELSRIPVVDWLGTAADLNGEVNPVAALAELLTNSRFGAGLPVALLDADGWDAVAGQLATDEFSVTVFLDTAKRLDALLNDFLEYLDAALFHTPDGKLSLRLLRDPVGPVPIDTDALLEPPDLTAHGWTETVNEVVVRFRNRDRGWQTDALTWRNPAAYAVTGRPLTQAIECDWITDPAVAWKVAMAYGKSRSLPWLDGRLRVRRGVGADLRPGDTVSLTYAHSGINAVRFRVLAVEVPGPDSAEVLLTVREDTAHLVVDDYPVPADEALAAVQYSPLPCHDVLVFEPPYAWTADVNPRLLVLPARGERLSSGFTLWWERATDSFTTAGTGQVFGRRGTLNAALDATGCLYHEAGLDVTFTSPDDDLDDMPFDEGVGTKRFLIFIGDEILLGWEPTLVSAGRYTVNLLRAQYGTTRGQHGIGNECWCVQLAELPMLEWAPPKDAVSVGLKIQPRLLHSEVSLADVAKITHMIQRRSLRPLGPANLTANGDGAHPTYATGQDVVLDWTLTSEARAGSDPEVDLECRADACVLELWAGAILKATLTVSRDGPYTLTNADLVAALGSETDFTVRAYLALGGYRSLDFDVITVCKV
ncbi:MAG TPA: phage tail protein [Verrucomicrobiota bacterium]|nr:phage tail protein [Verrucomicrobiota bacterium]HNU50142.1 phage tail protein [Verrucomicrobiota bacterium]